MRSGLLGDPVLEVMAGHEARLRVEGGQVAEHQPDHGQEDPLQPGQRVVERTPGRGSRRRDAILDIDEDDQAAERAGQQPRGVQRQVLAERRAGEVSPPNCQLMNSGRFEPKMMTNGAIAQLM